MKKLASLALAALISGCTIIPQGDGPPPKAPAQEPVTLPAASPVSIDGTQWSIESVGGIAIVGDTPPLVTFSGGRVAGSSGCNRFSGNYDLNASAITFGPIAATKMACPGAVMAQEARLFSLLTGTLGMAFRDEGMILILTAANGQTVMLSR